MIGVRLFSGRIGHPRRHWSAPARPDSTPLICGRPLSLPYIAFNPLEAKRSTSVPAGGEIRAE